MNKRVINLVVNTTVVGLLLAFAVGAAVTRRDFQRRNLVYAPAMSDTVAAGAQSESRLVAGGASDRQPPEGTVARGQMPFEYKAGPDGRERAGMKLRNPVEKSPEALARGRVVYGNFCGHCHGPLGYGDGPVAERAELGMPLVGAQTRRRADGQLFHIITRGRLLMPAHGVQIEPGDRWRVIHFIRALQEAAEKAERAAAGDGNGSAVGNMGW